MGKKAQRPPEPPSVPCISLVKECTPLGPYGVGDTITYDFTVTNCGNEPLQNIALVDAAASNIGQLPNEIPVAGSVVVQGQHTITPSEALVGSFTNTASVSAVGVTSATSATDTSTHVVSTEVSNGITMAKICLPAGPHVQGDTITYTMSVTNNGTVDVEDVVVTDPLASPSTLPVGTLSPNQTQAVSGTHVVTKAEACAGSIRNTATVTGNSLDGSTVSDTAQCLSATQANPSLVLTKTCAQSSGYQAGDTINYTLRVENTGNLTLGAGLITDPGSTIADANIPALAPGAVYNTTASHVVNAAEAQLPSYTNTAQATMDGCGVDDVTDSDSHTVSLVQCTEVCGHLVAPAVVKGLLPASQLDGPPGTSQAFDVGLGITWVTTWEDRTISLSRDSTVIGTNAFNKDNAVTHTLTGLAALAFDGCPPKVELKFGIWSLDFLASWALTPDWEITRNTGVTVVSSPTLVTTPDASDSPPSPHDHVDATGTFTQDGSYGNVWSVGPSNSSIALQWQGSCVYLPVKVKLINGVFDSAVDEAGNTYTQAQVEY